MPLALLAHGLHDEHARALLALERNSQLADALDLEGRGGKEADEVEGGKRTPMSRQCRKKVKWDSVFSRMVFW